MTIDFCRICRAEKPVEHLNTIAIKTLHDKWELKICDTCTNSLIKFIVSLAEYYGVILVK